MNRDNRKFLKYVLILCGLLFLAVIFVLLYVEGKAYTPTDFGEFTVICYDTGYYPTMTSPDSVQCYFIHNNIFYYDTTTTTALSTGIVNRRTSVCNYWYDSTGSWAYTMKAFKYGKTGGKSDWAWTVKTDPSESKRGPKYLYVKPDASATIGGTALSWADACSLSTVLARCTGANIYVIYIDKGIYPNAELDMTSKSGFFKFFGEGIGNTILIGKKDSGSELGAYFIFKPNMTDTAGFEVAYLSMHGYTATSGVQDSVTFAGISIYKSHGFYIHDCRIYNFFYGIHTCLDTKFGRVENCRFVNNKSVALHWEDAKNCWISHNVIDTISSGGIGIQLSASATQNFVYNNTINAPNGRAIVASGALVKQNNIIENYIWAISVDSVFITNGNNPFIGNHTYSLIDSTNTIEEDLASTVQANLIAEDSTLIAGIKAVTDKFLFDDSNYVKSDPFAFKGSPATATNLRLIYDGDSTTASRADFKQVTMKADGTNSHGLWIKATGSGSAIYADGRVGADFQGVDAAINVYSTGDGINIEGGTDGIAVYGSDRGIWVYGEDIGMQVEGVLDNAIYINSLSNYAGVRIRGCVENDNGAVELGGKADTSVKLGPTGSGKISGTFNNAGGYWHSVALASDSGLALVSVTGNIVDSASNSASEFKTDLTNAVDDHYNNALIYFTSGTNAGQPPRMIIDYAGASKYIKVSPAFEVEPTAGDDFKILYLLGRELGIQKIVE